MGKTAGTRPARKVSNPRWISLENRGLTAFPKVKGFSRIAWLDVSRNPIRDFAGLRHLASLCVLQANATAIATFKGSLRLPLLETLSLKGTPVAGYGLMSVMAVICFGPSLKTVNGARVDEKTTPRVARRCELVEPWLRKGFVLLDEVRCEVWRPGSSESVLIDVDVDVDPNEWRAPRELRIAELSEERDWVGAGGSPRLTVSEWAASSAEDEDVSWPTVPSIEATQFSEFSDDEQTGLSNPDPLSEEPQTRAMGRTRGVISGTAIGGIPIQRVGFGGDPGYGAERRRNGACIVREPHQAEARDRPVRDPDERGCDRGGYEQRRAEGVLHRWCRVVRARRDRKHRSVGARAC